MPRLDCPSRLSSILPTSDAQRTPLEQFQYRRAARADDQTSEQVSTRERAHLHNNALGPQHGAPILEKDAHGQLALRYDPPVVG